MEDDGNQVGFENNLDLSSLTYDQFTAFFFDRPIIPQGENWANEHWDLFRGEFDGFEASDPAKVLTHMLTAFQNWGQLTRIYSYEQAEQGGSFAMLGSQIRCYEHLYDPTIDLALRTRCIEAMYHPFADVVQHRPARLRAEKRPLHPSDEDDHYFMWWDFVLWNLWFQVDQHQNSILSDDLRHILDAAYATLLRILQLDDRYCQLCALHGLNHSKHPFAAETIQRYLDARRNSLTTEEIDFIGACRDGKYM